MPIEYHEYVRLRDVYMRDIAAVVAMRETIRVQRLLLNSVASREENILARGHLTKAVTNLDALETRLGRDLLEANENIRRVREEVQGV